MNHLVRPSGLPSSLGTVSCPSLALTYQSQQLTCTLYVTWLSLIPRRKPSFKMQSTEYSLTKDRRKNVYQVFLVFPQTVSRVHLKRLATTSKVHSTEHIYSASPRRCKRCPLQAPLNSWSLRVSALKIKAKLPCSATTSPCSTFDA